MVAAEVIVGEARAVAAGVEVEVHAVAVEMKGQHSNYPAHFTSLTVDTFGEDTSPTMLNLES